MNAINLIFVLDVTINYILLAGAAWSIVKPQTRIWPPPKKGSWQHVVTWILFCLAFSAMGILVVVDWNTWVLPNEIRYFIGLPSIAFGTFLVSWGIAALGVANTSGLRDRFVMAGPYRHTRNPQYLGDIILFVGISLLSNSLFVIVGHLLIIGVFLLTPLCEEVWLEEQYGDNYLQYKSQTPRFL